MTTLNIYVVIAAYNEEETIEKVIENVKTIFDKVVVVNDCSSDKTLDKINATGAISLNHIINLGQGAALQTGIEYCRLEKADYVITFDADGQHSIEDAKKMLDELVDTCYDIALGSRFLGTTINIPKNKKLLLMLAIYYTNLTTGLKLTDAHNGLRVMNKRIIDTINIKQNRMAHASEIIEIIAQNNFKYIEVPTTIKYTEYSIKKGQKWWGAFPIIIDMLLRKFRS